MAMIRGDWWHDRLLAVGFDYVDLYAKDQMSLDILVKRRPVRQTVLMIYSCRVGRKKLEPIESLPDETKKELWAICRPYTGTLNREEVKEFVRCYWLLSQLADLKEKSEI